MDSAMAIRTVNIHEAKTNLSQLIAKAANGEPFIIAKAGKPQVIVTRIEGPVQPQRIGFMQDQLSIPDDFDTLGQDEINQLFNQRS